MSESCGSGSGWGVSEWVGGAGPGTVSPGQDAGVGPVAGLAPVVPGSPPRPVAAPLSPLPEAVVAGPLPLVRRTGLVPPLTPRGTRTAPPQVRETPVGLLGVPAPAVVTGVVSVAVSSDVPPSSDRLDGGRDEPPGRGAVSGPIRAAAAMVGVLLVGSAWGIAATARHAELPPAPTPHVAEFHASDQDVNRFWRQG
jgi:hypothetical protein